MFERVLLCYDGSSAGRRALRRGAELAIRLKSRVFVLSIIPEEVADPAAHAGGIGHACLLDPRQGFRAYYPRPSGGYWWAGSQRKLSLAERVQCCVLVAVEPEASTDVRAAAAGQESAAEAADASSTRVTM